jgi:putative acetyltransferase
MPVIIRPEQPEDIAAIRVVNERAFGQPLESRLVDMLREHNAVMLSLVAVLNDLIVGHILFTPVQLGSMEGSGLAPMAVLPEYQRSGIGSQLVEEGLQLIRELGTPFVVVLGHPEYYPRFGFVPASKYNIRCEWEVPDEAFMVLPLDQRAMAGVSGLASIDRSSKP